MASKLVYGRSFFLRIRFCLQFSTFLSFFIYQKLVKANLNEIDGSIAEFDRFLGHQSSPYVTILTKATEALRVY